MKRLDALVVEYGLDAAAAGRLAALLDHVGGHEHAPTTVRDPAQAVDVHVADSLSGLAFAPLRAARCLADLGAGAGFPGLVLAVALPEARVTLVESGARKAEFLRGAAAASGIAVEVVAERVESWDAGRAACDVVTARALAPLPVLAEYAAPLLSDGGHLLAWKAAPDAEEEAAGARAAAELGLEPLPPLDVRPFAAARHRRLHPFRKIAPTPPRYPRRPGMATKRPLGAGTTAGVRPIGE